MSMTMKALMKTTPELTELKNIPIPQYGAKEVLVRVRSAALCGTDLHVYNWNHWAQGAGIQLPVVMGHECCGDVVAVGSGVKGIKAGDKVVVETHIPCGECYQCQNGEQHICNHLKMFSIHTNGGFAEYTVMPAECTRKIPHEISYDVGALLEPIGTALRAVETNRVGGRNVVVVGCGPIGLFAVAAAAALGAAKILAIDISAYRLTVAEKVGADIVINTTEEDSVQTVLASTGGYGADVVIEASGSVEGIKQSFKFLRKGGRVALIGLPDQPVEFDLVRDIVFKEAKITGIHGREMFKTWTQIENLLVSGKLVVEPVITHVLPLAQWQEGIDLAKKGQACKVIYRP